MVRLAARTEAIIFVCMSVGMPGVTKTNYVEFYMRLALLESIKGAYISVDGEPAPYTLEQVRQHAGLKVNVGYEYPSSWWARILHHQQGDIDQKHETETTWGECRRHKPCSDEHYIEIYQKCGPVVAALVEMLTKPEKRDFRNKRYLARLEAGPPELMLIKIADRVDNLNSLKDADWSKDRLQYYLEDSQRIWDIAYKRHMGRQAKLLLPGMTALAELLTKEEQCTQHT